MFGRIFRAAKRSAWLENTPCLDLDWLCLCRFHHRCLFVPDCRLARQPHGAYGVRACASKGTSCAKSTPHSTQQNQLKFLLDEYRSINAPAETINGLYKTEVIHRRGPWRSFEAVEFTTLEWLDWFNNKRLLALIGYIPPTEAEERHYASLDQPSMAA
jgi:hypothetical protein